MALDTNAAWDINGRLRDPAEQRSVELLKADLQWLQEDENLQVVIPFYAWMEFAAEFRDLLSRESMVRDRVPSWDRKSIKRYTFLQESTLNAIEHEIDAAKERLSWCDRPPCGIRKAEVARFCQEVVTSASLTRQDAYVFCAAVEARARFFITSDKDFGASTDVLKGIVGERLPTFINQRKYLRLKPSTPHEKAQHADRDKDLDYHFPRGNRTALLWQALHRYRLPAASLGESDAIRLECTSDSSLPRISLFFRPRSDRPTPKQGDMVGFVGEVFQWHLHVDSVDERELQTKGHVSLHVSLERSGRFELVRDPVLRSITRKIMTDSAPGHYVDLNTKAHVFQIQNSQHSSPSPPPLPQ